MCNKSWKNMFVIQRTRTITKQIDVESRMKYEIKKQIKKHISKRIIAAFKTELVLSKYNALIFTLAKCQ